MLEFFITSLLIMMSLKEAVINAAPYGGSSYGSVNYDAPRPLYRPPRIYYPPPPQYTEQIYEPPPPPQHQTEIQVVVERQPRPLSVIPLCEPCLELAEVPAIQEETMDVVIPLGRPSASRHHKTIEVDVETSNSASLFPSTGVRSSSSGGSTAVDVGLVETAFLRSAAAATEPRPNPFPVLQSWVGGE
ncbi:hypothetical protein BV898_06327 [Hypsibius exemplaris]|uniref:Uncharacterized protein n=1 Tax=Hypsibius exemplaris TaxID=2072580 RepID=A0A1W0WWI3_HYPEX|nr:hypothetical protein BV898_06327 [Hypsibius exemplaris]